MSMITFGTRQFVAAASGHGLGLTSSLFKTSSTAHHSSPIIGSLCPNSRQHVMKFSSCGQSHHKDEKSENAQRTSPTSTMPTSPQGVASPWKQPSFWKCSHTWSSARTNTLRCLVGCSLGDFSSLFLMQSQYPDLPMSVTMPVAMACGISTSVALETAALKIERALSYGEAFRTAIGMSMVSMLTMETAENIVDYSLTGGVTDFSSPIFYAALVPSLMAGFIVPLPYNYYMLKRHGKACH